MLKFIALLLFVLIITDITTAFIIASNTNWLFSLSIMLGSALLGLAVIFYVILRYRSIICKDILNILDDNLMDTDDKLTDKYLMLISGGLLILPGYSTDAVGLILLLPFVRRCTVSLLAKIAF